MNNALLLSLLGLLSACGGSSGGSSTSSNMPDRVFAAADSTFASVYSPVSFLPLNGTIQNINTSFACDAHGNPDGTEAPAEKGAAYFYCKLNTNDNTPETVRGGYSVVKSILCGIGKQVNLSFPDLPIEHAVSLDFDNDPCFSTLEETGVMPLYVTQQSLNGSDWDYKMILSSAPNAASPIYYIHLKNSDGILAVKATDFNTNQNFWQGFSLNIDTTAGKVRYDSWDPQYGRHLRLLISGTLTAAGFSTVTSRFMAYADQTHIPANSVFVSGAWNATNERYVLEQAGVAAGGYPTCVAPCGTLMTIDNHINFADFTGWAGSAHEDKLHDSTSLYLNYATIDTSNLIP